MGNTNSVAGGGGGGGVGHFQTGLVPGVDAEGGRVR